MENVFKAFAKISLKDKLVFFFVFVLAVCGIAAGLIKMSMKGISGEYPDCTLAPIGDLYEYKEVSYQDLSIRIKFPGTTYGVNVGGEALSSEGDAAVFDYGDGLTIMAFKSMGDLKGAITEYVPAAFSTKKFTSYEAKIKGHGFLNAMEMDYSTGVIKCADAPYYCVFYEKDGCAVGVVTKEHKDLSKAKKLLDRIAATFSEGKVVDTAPSGDVSADNGNKDASEGEAGKEVSATADSTSSKAEPSADSKKKSGAHAYPDEILADDIDYSKYHEAITIVDKELDGKDVYFIFNYTNVNEIPSSAYLVSPDKKVYMPVYAGENGDGLIRFEVSGVKSGEWHAYTSGEDNIGYFDLYAISKEAYDSMVPNSLKGDDAAPRIGE